MSENVKFIVTEVNKLLGRNYNLIGFNALNAEDLLQVSQCYFISSHFRNNSIHFLIDIVLRVDEDTATK